jgi:hypothetical protein
MTIWPLVPLSVTAAASGGIGFDEGRFECRLGVVLSEGSACRQ